MISNHHKKVVIPPTKSVHYYDYGGRYQFVDLPHDIKLEDIPLAEVHAVIFCYDSNNENTLNSVRKKWHASLEKKLSKVVLKHGMILLGINFGPSSKECAFNHKVALAYRGMSIQPSKSLAYHVHPDSKE